MPRLAYACIRCRTRQDLCMCTNASQHSYGRPCTPSQCQYTSVMLPCGSTAPISMLHFCQTIVQSYSYHELKGAG